MRVGLIPLKTEVRNPGANLERLARCLARMAPYQPDLVCLPECTLTGYLYDEADLRQFAEPIPGPLTEQMGRFARTYAFHLCFGLLEAATTGVYNAAVLLDSQGRVILKHQKLAEQPPFTKGDAVNSVDAACGRLGILICGDLFDKDVVRRLDPSLDLLLMPMSRSFAGRSPDVRRWHAEERRAYLEAVQAAGVTTLIVNALETDRAEPGFGGAMIVNGQGELMVESPHGTDDVVVWDLAGVGASSLG